MVWVSALADAARRKDTATWARKREDGMRREGREKRKKGKPNAEMKWIIKAGGHRLPGLASLYAR